MREIKFRAWNRDYMITECGWFVEFDGDVWENTQGDGAMHDLLESRKPIELMQYIGRKDMKGVEIWDGDIVKYSSWNTSDGSSPMGYSEWKTGDVYFVDAKFVVRGNEIWDTFEYKNIEVIGNIYENPELLK